MVKIKKQKIHSRNNRIFFLKRPSIRFLSVLKFLAAVLILAIIGFWFLKIKYMFVDSDYFIFKDIEIELYDSSGASKDFSLDEIKKEELDGSNIFFVDLKVLKNKIEDRYAELKNVIVRRVLPDKVIVYAELREPVAQIRSDRYYFIDKEGVLLPDVKNFPDTDFPIIIGIRGNLAKVSKTVFSEFDMENIKNGLSLINEIVAIEEALGYKLRMVDITDPGNILFFLDSVNVEIKIGNSDFRNRLNVLMKVLEQMGSDVDKFKYIDLRFEDPIIGPR